MASMLRQVCNQFKPFLLNNKVQQSTVVSVRFAKTEVIQIKKELRRMKKESVLAARKKEQEENKPFPPVKVEYGMESLATRGFLRNMKAYTPPNDVEERILNAARTVFTSADSDTIREVKLDDPLLKYKLLVKCFKEFDHEVSNSQLHKMKTVGDVVEYYRLPVKTTTTFDDLVKAELPPNLHVVPNYVRFDPEADNKFGISAFPGNSVKIRGLKAKKLYKSYNTANLGEKMRTKLEYFEKVDRFERFKKARFQNHTLLP